MPKTPTIRPGVFIEEVPGSARPIREVPTSVTAFVGRALQGPVDEPTAVASWTEFENRFGGLIRDYPLTYAIRDFFANGGRQAVVVRVVARTGRRPMRVCAKGGGPLTVDDYIGDEAGKRGLYALDKVDLFNLLCIPPDTPAGNVPAAVYRRAASYCYRRRAMLLIDPDREWGEGGDGAARRARDGVQVLGLTGVEARNAALFFPRICQPDPERQGTFAPCGAVAGVIARTDARWGVWKAPAGTAAMLLGTAGLQTDLSDADIGMLSPAGINGLRFLTGIGPVVWGARTLRRPVDEFMYIPIRRLALFIEESLIHGLRWAVFEPDCDALRAEVRAAAGAFMDGLWRRGAFPGSLPEDAFFVKCDRETTTPAESEQGIVVLVVGFAATRPGEFVVLKIPVQAGGVSRVSGYEALPEMDASGNAVGIVTRTLEHEGWERDENGNLD
ncbi:MAG TPA: phage tail sheath subtilisin-like domain-containing protein [Methanoculleus sp.]|nr:phage tail sheath subtilisin-like domain-containing protein [Methanoculleus sp.]